MSDNNALAGKVAAGKGRISKPFVATTLSETLASVLLKARFWEKFATQPLNAADFTAAVVQNAGITTTATVTSVTKANAVSLAGGEQVIRVYLSYDVYPVGVETIEITPANVTSIYDDAGNA